MHWFGNELHLDMQQLFYFDQRTFFLLRSMQTGVNKSQQQISFM